MGKTTLYRPDLQVIPGWAYSLEDSIAPDGSVAHNVLKNPANRASLGFLI